MTVFGKTCMAWLSGIVLAAGGHAAETPTLTLPAAEFRLRPVGQASPDGWNLCVNGAIRHPVTFHQDGLYNFVVVARGEFAVGQWPGMQVLLDDRPVYRTEVTDSNLMPYAFLVSASSGIHEIAIGFLNDAREGEADRNLHLSTLTLVAPTGTAFLASTPDDEYEAWQTNRLAQWEALLDGRIATNRRGDLVIWTLGDRDEPLTNVAVSVRQRRHEFRFGTALCADMFSPDAPPEADAYREHVLRYFNAAVVENAMKWPAMEPKENLPDYAPLDRLAAWCSSNRIVLRGHCLFWGCEVPAWARALPTSNLWEAAERRIWKTVNRYSEAMEDFDVLNEPLHCLYFEERWGLPGLARLFNGARDAAPRAGRFINEYGILEAHEGDRYAAFIRALLNAGAGISGIGVQAHFEGAADSRHIDRSIDQLAEFGLPIRITELDAYSADEAIRVSCVSNVLKTAFAHPAVDAILFWGFWEKRHWKPEAALFKADFSRTALADLYEQMVFSNWWTQTAGFSDSVGRFATPAFFGEYEIEALTPDGLYTNRTVRLNKAEGAAVVTLHLGAMPSENRGKEPIPVF